MVFIIPTVPHQDTIVKVKDVRKFIKELNFFDLYSNEDCRSQVHKPGQEGDNRCPAEDTIQSNMRKSKIEKSLPNFASMSTEEAVEKASILNSLGITKAKTERWIEALGFWRTAMALRVSFLGESHPDVADTLSNIAIALGKLDKEEEAMQNFKNALDIKIKNFGKCHSDVAATYHNMANLQRKTKKYEESLAYFTESLQIKQQLLGEKHFDVAVAVVSIGHVLYEMGHYKKAHEKYTEGLKIFKQIGLPDEHPNVVQTYLDQEDAANRASLVRY